jgi:RNA polymerase sigma-B factor
MTARPRAVPSRAHPSAVARQRAEDGRLGRLCRAGDPLAREALIRRYLPLARSLARRFGGGLEPIDDLVQVASLGLLKAVDRWDPGRGFAFSSFAVPTILGELKRHFRDATWTVRPPRGLLELCLWVERASEPVSAMTGRAPSVADIAAQLGRSPEEVEEALQAAEGRTAHSLDEPVAEGEPEPGAPAHLTGRIDPGYEQADARVTLQRLTSVLDDRSREMLRLRFEEDARQSDIAEQVGCSPMHVSRTIRASLERLQAFGAG